MTPPPINIDGTNENYSNVTIDGQDVEQITIDGQDVLSAIPDEQDLHARYDATELSLSDQDDVTAWSDATGNGHDLSGGTPTYIASGINGNPIVQFDGVDDFLDASWTAFSQPYQVFIVFRYRGLSEFERVYGGVNSSTRALLNTDGGASNWQIGTSSFTAGGTPDTNAHIGNAFYGSTGSLRIDGSDITSGGVGSNDMGSIRLAQSSEGEFEALVDIGEILIYPEDKTSRETDIEQYLADKWSFTL